MTKPVFVSHGPNSKLDKEATSFLSMTEMNWGMGVGMDVALHCLFERDLLITTNGLHLSDVNGTLTMKSLKGAPQKWKLKNAGGDKVFIISSRSQYLINRGGDPVLSSDEDEGEAAQWSLASAGVGKVSISSQSEKQLEAAAESTEVALTSNSEESSEKKPWAITLENGSPACFFQPKWRRIAQCSGATSVDRLDFKPEIVRVMAEEAKQVKICATTDDTTECVVSMKDSSPIQMIRRGLPISHGELGGPCGSDCVDSIWEGSKPRLAALKANCSYKSEELKALNGSSKFFHACDEEGGLHAGGLQIALDDNGACSWGDVEEYLEIFIDVGLDLHALKPGCSAGESIKQEYGEARYDLHPARAGEVVCCNEETGMASRKLTLKGGSGEEEESCFHTAAGVATYFEAAATCREAGMQLCGAQEEIDQSCDTGCGLNAALVWTSNSRTSSVPVIGAATKDRHKNDGARRGRDDGDTRKDATGGEHAKKPSHPEDVAESGAKKPSKKREGAKEDTPAPSKKPAAAQIQEAIAFATTAVNVNYDQLTADQHLTANFTDAVKKVVAKAANCDNRALDVNLQSGSGDSGVVIEVTIAAAKREQLVHLGKTLQPKLKGLPDALQKNIEDIPHVGDVCSGDVAVANVVGFNIMMKSDDDDQADQVQASAKVKVKAKAKAKAVGDDSDDKPSSWLPSLLAMFAALASGCCIFFMVASCWGDRSSASPQRSGRSNR